MITPRQNKNFRTVHTSSELGLVFLYSGLTQPFRRMKRRHGQISNRQLPGFILLYKYNGVFHLKLDPHVYSPILEHPNRNSGKIIAGSVVTREFQPQFSLKVNTMASGPEFKSQNIGNT